MKEHLKRALARRLGMITAEEHSDLLVKSLRDMKRQCAHAIAVREQERQALFERMQHLKGELADAREHVTHLLERQAQLANLEPPSQVIIKGDF